MRLSFLIFVLLFFSACKKSTDSIAARLSRTESTDYDANVLHTKYKYDNNGRIISITNYQNADQPVVAVTINYSGSEAVLLSFPETDPAYDQTTEIHLTLDENGRTLKRVEYSHALAKMPSVQPTEKFRYDTLLSEYDAGGFVKKTKQSRFDSTWVDSAFTSVTRLTSTVNYTLNSGNITASDEYAVYPVITRRGSMITVSGGSSEYHNEFRYTKSFLNKTDFTNASILNEKRLFYELPLNISYKNMPDQVIMNSVDKDINGAVIFSGNSTIDIERTYNADRSLSSVNILSHNTPYTKINYFYER